MICSGRRGSLARGSWFRFRSFLYQPSDHQVYRSYVYFFSARRKLVFLHPNKLEIISQVNVNGNRKLAAYPNMPPRHYIRCAGYAVCLSGASEKTHITPVLLLCLKWFGFDFVLVVPPFKARCFRYINVHASFAHKLA